MDVVHDSYSYIDKCGRVNICDKNNNFVFYAKLNVIYVLFLRALTNAHFQKNRGHTDKCLTKINDKPICVTSSNLPSTTYINSKFVDTWHERYVHIGKDKIMHTNVLNFVKGMPLIKNSKKPCQSCILSKQRQISIKPIVIMMFFEIHRRIQNGNIFKSF